MSSSKDRKLRYFKDRSTNAYWMLRQGRFKLFYEMLKVEANVQFDGVRSRINQYAEVGSQPRLGSDSQAPGSGPVADLHSEYIVRRRLETPSYKPTMDKPATAVNMKADSGVVKDELRRVLASFNVRERG